MPYYWEGPTLRLRAVSPNDADAHQQFNLSTDYGLLDQQFPPSSPQSVQQWTINQATTGGTGDAFTFQMEDKASGELVGGIATHDLDRRTGVLEYGLHVFEGHRQRGFASEAICLVLRYYFQERRYQKANARVYSPNLASQRLHASLGFQLEGRIRRTMYTRGEPGDTLVYGITVEEFRERHPDFWLPALADEGAPWPEPDPRQ